MTAGPTPAIRLHGVTKRFPIDREAITAFSHLRRRLTGGQARRHVLALDDVSIDVMVGERVGLIGHNGAGKTTLLRTIAGLYRPTAGQATVEPDLTLLTGLGLGMIEELTVTDNIELYGAIHGLDRRRIREVHDDVLEWADLVPFARATLRTLSTGMASRLAFSVTRHLDKRLYLMDEALTAGDRTFDEKCDAVFERFKATGRTFVVSTHSLDFVRRFCTRAVWLDHGRLQASGDPAEVVGLYETGRRETPMASRA